MDTAAATERGREREGGREGVREVKKENGGRDEEEEHVGGESRGGGWIDDIDQAPLEIKASGLYFFQVLMIDR